MSITDKERIVALETSITYIKEKLDSIDGKVDGLVGFKMQVAGIGAFIALVVSCIANMVSIN